MQISIKNRNYFALSAVSFLHLFAWSAAMSFFAIWLGQHLGIGATKTGLLYSANALAALCMQPVLGFISDKIGLKKTLLFTILIILLLIGPFFIYIYGPLLVSNFYLGAILGGIYLGFIFNAGYGVIDSYINKVSIKYGFEYGRARMWGSFGWAAATYTTGIAMNINPNSLTILKNCVLEPELANAKPEDRFQFVRNGYFCVDNKDSKGNVLVFNRIVSLKSSFKLQK